MSAADWKREHNEQVVPAMIEKIETLEVERDEARRQVAALEAIQDEAEAELVRFTDALMTVKRRIADAFAGDNLHSEARAIVGYIKDVLAEGRDSEAAKEYYATLAAHPAPPTGEEERRVIEAARLFLGWCEMDGDVRDPYYLKYYLELLDAVDALDAAHPDAGAEGGEG